MLLHLSLNNALAFLGRDLSAIFWEVENPKWFDQPFDRLRVSSRVEGLTTLSHVEGQYPMIQIQMTKTVGCWVSVLNLGALEF
jgi:hypothetical protein